MSVLCSLSAAKFLLFLTESKQEQIPRSARDDVLGGFFSSAVMKVVPFQRPAGYLGVGLALLMASPLVVAQERSVVPLIPAANWRVVGSQKEELDTIAKWGGDPVIEKEYGVRSLTERTYQLDSHTAQAILEETPDASSAYGLLTFYQTETMSADKSMGLTVIGPRGALLARGRVFIRVARPDEYPLSDSDFHALLIFIGGMRFASATTIGLPAPLPEAGRIPCSEKYVLGPEAARRVLPSFPAELIGFAQGAEVQTANYLTGPPESPRARLLLISYPNPQIARERYASIEKSLRLNQDRGAEPRADGVSGSVYGTRRGAFILVVLNSPSRVSTNKLLDEFNVSQQVSWDQRPPDQEPIVVQVAKLVLGNMLLVLILVGFALGGGTLVFVFKRLTARWFPGSSWAQPDEGYIISLRLR